MSDSAEEMAKKLVLEIKFGEKPLMANAMRNLIATALREYGRELMNKSNQWISWEGMKEREAKSRNAALLEAQEKAEQRGWRYLKDRPDSYGEGMRDCADLIAEEIQQLRESK